MSVRIELAEEGVTVTPTCSHCKQPLAVCDGWMSWRCDTEGCWVRVVPMWEDADFIDDDGVQWVPIDDEEGGWVDMVADDMTGSQ